jgi:PII-like signaling protein
LAGAQFTHFHLEVIMELLQAGALLRIFIGESDKYEGKLLYEWLVMEARKQQLAGATVLRGIMGFGASSRISTTQILRLSRDLPVVVELVDTEDRLMKFLEIIDEAIKGGMATLEKARVHFYRKHITADR